MKLTNFVKNTEIDLNSVNLVIAIIVSNVKNRKVGNK